MKINMDLMPNFIEVNIDSVNRNLRLSSKKFTSITTSERGFYNISLPSVNGCVIGFRYVSPLPDFKIELYSDSRNQLFIRT